MTLRSRWHAIVPSMQIMTFAATALTTSFVAFSQEAEPSTKDIEITLEKIMSDPKWIANTPQQATWLPDSNHIVFKQNIEVGVCVRLGCSRGHA